jgi:DNA polymerase type B, organellar and viral
MTDYLVPLDELPSDVTEEYGVFDLETLAPDNEKVWAVGYRDRNGYKRWDVNDGRQSTPYGPEDVRGPLHGFLSHVFSGRSRTLYAHNGGNFDHQYVARWLLEHGEAHDLTTQIIPLSSSIMAMVVTTGKGKDRREWKILDSMRILPMSLEKVAQTFGIEGKWGGKHDEAWYATLHRNPDRYKYLSQDIDILWKAVSHYGSALRKLGSNVAISAASTAMRLFRKKFQTSHIAINRHWDGCELPEGPGEGHCVGCAHDFFREAYYGGRVEVFDTAAFESTVDVYYGDINSMYPHAMLGPMPTGAMRESKDLNDGKTDEIGFFEATVSIPRTCGVPPLPYRSNGRGLLFPTGVFRGVWDYCELELLRSIGGTVKEVHRGAWIEGRRDLSDYVTALFALRDKSRPDYNEGLAAIAKILLNSLYGKFGSDYDRESIWINPTVEDITENGLRDCCDRYHTLFLEDVFAYPDYLIPQVAAHITAMARANLWRYLIEASNG